MRRSLLLACFFLSGAAGLVYEVLWTRTLSLTFGHTVWAMTTVLAVFMGGLALGSALFGRPADRSRDPARLYGLLELLIGLYCLAAPSLLALARKGHLWLLPLVGDSLPARTALQFLLSSLTLLLPATLMGGTVPAVAKALIRDRRSAGSEFGLLYGANTLGAAAGAFAAGYWLIPAAGMVATNRMAAAVNIAVGAIFLLPRKGGVEGVAAAAEPLPVSPEARGGALLPWAFAVTGAAAMVFQVAWVRSLILVIGSSTYAFSSILVAVLLGIALGSRLFSLFRLPSAELAWRLLAGIGVFALLLLPFFDALPRLFLALFRGYGGSYGYVQLAQFLVVLPVVLVPATLMGMCLPCLMGMVVRDGGGVGGRVGRFYAFNTAGSIVGSVLAGFVLIPGLGAQKALAVAILAEFLLAAAFLSLSRPPLRTAACSAAALLAVAAFLVPSWSKGAMNLAVSVKPWELLDGGKDFGTESRELSRKLLYAREGISSNVAVFGETDGYRWFTVNGKTDGGSGDLTPQVRLAMFPMLLHPSPRRVAVLGLGTGVTAGTASLFEGVESIDIVELEPAMVEAARFFDAENGRILDNPRARLRLDDGRSFFESRRNAFDVIVSEPSNPWIAGVSNLFTADFFRSARESLAPGGVFGLWLQGYTISRESYALVLRTFLGAFPDSTVWLASWGDTIIVGRKEGGGAVRDPAALTKRLRGNPRLAAALGEGTEISAEPLLTSYLLGADGMARFAGAGPVNTDDRNLLEFSAPRSLYGSELNRILRDMAGARGPFPPAFLDMPEARGDAFLRRAGERHIREHVPSLALYELSALPSLAPPLPPAGSVAERPGEAGRSETFDGPPSLPLIPATAEGRAVPEDSEDEIRWRAQLARLTRSEGVVRGAGRGGSAALVLRGARSSPAGYLVPLAVEGWAEYELRCMVRGSLGEKGRAGVTVREYDSPEDDGAQPLPAFDGGHLLGEETLLRVSGRTGWTEKSFRFRPSPGTALVRLFFFLEGGAAEDEAAFDDLFLRRLP